MSDVDQLTAEESAAIEAMQSEDTAQIEEPVAEPGEAETEPEEQPEFKSSRAKEKPPEGYVPHQAMHEERVKRQELERERAELAQRLAAYEAAQREAEQRAQEPQWVDPLIDPDGFKRYQDFQLQRTQQMVMQQQRAMQARQAQEARQADVVRAEQAFRQQAPDYDDAVRHIAEARAAELRMYGMSEAEIQRQIMQDANNVYEGAKRMRMNPAQLVYQLAQQRGYAAQQRADAASQVEALAEAQRQTQGLGSGGSRQPSRLTATQIAAMSEAEIAKLNPDDIARAFGG